MTAVWTATSNGRGPVDHATLEEMQSLDVGSWYGDRFRGEGVLTLDEVFELLPPDYLINVEMKAVIKWNRLIAHRVAEVVRRHQRWASTLVASFNPIALWELRKIEPRIIRGYIWSRRHPPPIRSRCFNRLVQAHWYDPANDSYNSRLLNKVRQRGARMLAWDSDFGCDSGEDGIRALGRRRDGRRGPPAGPEAAPRAGTGLTGREWPAPLPDISSSALSKAARATTRSDLYQSAIRCAIGEGGCIIR